MIKQITLENNLIKTYAETEGIRYKIQKIGTEEVYDEAIDLPNEVRASKGLETYYYFETKIKVEENETEE